MFAKSRLFPVSPRIGGGFEPAQAPGRGADQGGVTRSDDLTSPHDACAGAGLRLVTGGSGEVPARGWRRSHGIRARRGAERGLSPLQRYSFDVDGFLLLEGALDPARVRHLRSVIEGRDLPAPDHTIGRQRFGGGGQLFEWDPLFTDLIDHPWVVAVLRELIGAHVRLDHAYGIIMAPGTAGLGLHGPAEPFDPAQYYLSRHGVPRSGLLAFSWALTDGRPGDGGFGCIPGSHRATVALPEGAESLLVEVPQPAGSLLVFTEALAHCTIPWTGAGRRLVVMLKYSPGNSAWDPSPAAPAATVAAMPEARRRFFQPPSVGGHQPVLDP